MADTEFAKTHLRDHLSSLLVPHIAEGFWSIYSSSKELCERTKQPDQILRTFQNMLTKIPDWTDSTLSTEVERIQKVTRCTYMDDLLMGVFIAYMKSFANLHYSGSSKEIQIDFERPSLAKFIHELYIHSARKLWQTAYLFRTVGTTTEEQARNRKEIEQVIGLCLEGVIRGFLPWESIAKRYFAQPEPQDVLKAVERDEEEEEEESPVAEKKSVTFGGDDSESEDEGPPKLLISEEEATLDIPELETEQKKEEPEEEDAMKELEGKISESLVLNL
jgi:hypothetical protein